MAHEPNPIKALVRSKKFQVVLAWTIYLGWIARGANAEQAVELLGSASIVVAAYLLGQSAADAVAIYVGKDGNGEK